MGVAGRIGAFAAVLAVIAAGAALTGSALDPDAAGGKGDEPHGDDAASAPEAREVPGLAVADGGLRLVADTTRLPAREARPFRFRVLDRESRTVRDFEVEQERRMHLIVVRRDLTGYQHLHPRQSGDGSWEVDLRLPRAGTYRVFADFTRAGETQTLGTDVAVAGDFRPEQAPAPRDRVPAGDGYEVDLASDGGELRFVVSRDGRRLDDIEPYLGARGHLVAVREGDLAYLHVHPESEATEGSDIRFAVEYPSAGRYRLFLQFKHQGRVRIAALTQEVGDGSGH